MRTKSGLSKNLHYQGLDNQGLNVPIYTPGWMETLPVNTTRVKCFVFLGKFHKNTTQ